VETTYQFHQKRHEQIAWRVINYFTRLAIFLLSRSQVRGTENIPEQGALLMVANHVSFADQYLLATTSKRKIIFMAKEELFRYGPIRLVVRAFGAFPVRRGGMNRQALNKAYQVLDSGLALALFPEGTRSKNAQLQPAQPGSALIALHRGVPILPVGITGMEIVRKGLLWVIFHRPRVTANIGRPFYLPTVNDKPSKEKLRELADYIMAHIAQLLPHEYQGYYAKKGRLDDTKG
jgi:1-acyl-sn-glycerol-3-phosphate acyltransferase